MSSERNVDERAFWFGPAQISTDIVGENAVDSLLAAS